MTNREKLRAVLTERLNISPQTRESIVNEVFPPEPRVVTLKLTSHMSDDVQFKVVDGRMLSRRPGASATFHHEWRHYFTDGMFDHTFADLYANPLNDD